jgi:glutaredoxin
MTETGFCLNIISRTAGYMQTAKEEILVVAMNKVAGTKDAIHSIRFFGLSTCIWCRKTKALLDSLGVPYEFIYVDKLTGQEETEIMQEVRKFNPSVTYPTLVIDNSKVIKGFRESEIRRELS